MYTVKEMSCQSEILQTSQGIQYKKITHFKSDITTRKTPMANHGPRTVSVDRLRGLSVNILL